MSDSPVLGQGCRARGSGLLTHHTEAKPLHQPRYFGATEDTKKCLPVTMEMLNWRI